MLYLLTISKKIEIYSLHTSDCVVGFVARPINVLVIIDYTTE